MVTPAKKEEAGAEKGKQDTRKPLIKLTAERPGSYCTKEDELRCKVSLGAFETSIESESWVNRIFRAPYAPGKNFQKWKKYG